jgi:two-component system, response regulator RegA
MNPENAPRTLLLVDDDDTFRNRLAHALGKRNCEVWPAADADRAVQRARLDSPELAIVDLRMPGQSGLALIRALLDIDPDTRILVLTAYGSIATALEAVRLGAKGFLQKPASVDEILLALTADTDHVTRSGPEPPSQVPTLARAEWEHINRVLAECQGNVCQAARLLGVHRRTLQRKLAKRPVEE